MKTTLTLIILFIGLALKPVSAHTINVFENPETFSIDALNTPFVEVADSTIERYNETRFIISNTKSNLIQSQIMYVNVLYFKTIQKREFYIKRVVSVNEITQMRMEIIKVKLGNRTLKVILSNCSIFKFLFDNYQS